MNMIAMLALASVFYFITLVLIVIFRDKINIKVGNLLFVIVDVIFFLCWNIAAYQKGWLEDGFMTLENISPMVCTVIPFIYIMNDRVKKCCLSMVAFLSVGMFAAMYISPEYAYLFNFNVEASFIYASEACCHLVCSLFGVYLVLTKQVKTDFSHWWRALAFTFAIVGYGVLLNFLFHKANFGMNPYGSYSIYFLDIFGSFWATLVAYVIGVFLVITLGMQIMHIFCSIVSKYDKHHKHAHEPVGDPEGQSKTL